MDTIEVEILEDGSLKITTNKIGMANHGSAEALLREISAGAGGKTNRVRKGMHSHTHSQGEMHEH